MALSQLTLTTHNMCLFSAWHFQDQGEKDTYKKWPSKLGSVDGLWVPKHAEHVVAQNSSSRNKEIFKINGPSSMPLPWLQGLPRGEKKHSEYKQCIDYRKIKRGLRVQQDVRGGDESDQRQLKMTTKIQGWQVRESENGTEFLPRKQCPLLSQTL